MPNVLAVRIVRPANFVIPRSGGLRTALQVLGEGCLAADTTRCWSSRASATATNRPDWIIESRLDTT